MNISKVIFTLILKRRLILLTLVNITDIDFSRWLKPPTSLILPLTLTLLVGISGWWFGKED